jgi:hypothetical protein
MWCDVDAPQLSLRNTLLCALRWCFTSALTKLPAPQMFRCEALGAALASTPWSCGHAGAPLSGSRLAQRSRQAEFELLHDYRKLMSLRTGHRLQFTLEVTNTGMGFTVPAATHMDFGLSQIRACLIDTYGV